jgi:phospholipid-transporting ATPase
MKKNSDKHKYLNLIADPGFGSFIIQFLTYWVAYSHLIPISLYVVLEIIKMGQANLIAKDIFIYDPETGFSNCRNSDLIEEMGQVEFIFSDKTGTLTCNVMKFKQCSINGKVF